MNLASRIAFTSTALFGAVIAVAATSSDATAPRTGPTSRESYTEKYSIVAEKNIFLRDRSRPAATSRSSSTNTSRRHEKTAEETLVLTGVVFEDGEFHAYVEDTSADKILRLAPGDSVARGRVGQIEIDALLYQAPSGKPQWVDIGSDFTGKAYESSSDSSSGSSSGSASETPSTGAAASQPAINPNDPNLTTEQKMRLRAQQQRGGRR